jgi:hypothetical protein
MRRRRAMVMIAAIIMGRVIEPSPGAVKIRNGNWLAKLHPWMYFVPIGRQFTEASLSRKGS